MPNCIECRYFNVEIQPETTKLIMCTGSGMALESCKKINGFRPKLKEDEPKWKFA